MKVGGRVDSVSRDLVVVCVLVFYFWINGYCLVNGFFCWGYGIVLYLGFIG